MRFFVVFGLALVLYRISYLTFLPISVLRPFERTAE